MYTSILNIENIGLIGIAYLVCIGIMVPSFVVAESAASEQTGNHTDFLIKSYDLTPYMTGAASFTLVEWPDNIEVKPSVDTNWVYFLRYYIHLSIRTLDKIFFGIVSMQ